MPNDIFLPKVVELTKAGHTVTITARGWSMMPFIHHDRDSIVLTALPPKVVKGDFVLAEIAQGHYVCHRVEQITESRVVLRGDGNIQGTEQCRPEDLRAIVTAVIRNGRRYGLSSSRLWALHSFLWPRLLPLRRILLALYRLLWMHQLPHRLSCRSVNRLW